MFRTIRSLLFNDVGLLKHSTQTEQGNIDAEINRLIEAWKHSLSVQQHFNDLSLRIRNIAVTVLGAGLAATGILVDKEYYLEVPSVFLFPSVITLILGIIVIFLADRILPKVAQVLPSYQIRNKLALISILIYSFVTFGIQILYSKNFLEEYYNLNLGGVSIFLLAIVFGIFYLLDRYWYHKLLLGAVYHGRDVETRLTELGAKHFHIGRSITKESDINVGGIKISSEQKLDLVYRPVIIALMLTSATLCIYNTHIIKNDPKTLSKLNLKITGLESEYSILISENKSLNARIDSLNNIVTHYKTYFRIIGDSSIQKMPNDSVHFQSKKNNLNEEL